MESNSGASSEGFVDTDENEPLGDSVTFTKESNDQASIIVNEVRPRPRCQGKEFWIGSSPSLYRNYPFHRHFISSGNENYKLSHRINDPDVGENKIIVHSLYCKDELIDEEGRKKGCNKMCSDVIDTNSFKNMLKSSASMSTDPNMPTEMLTYEQLQNNYRDLRTKLDKKKLENLNLERRNIAASKRASLNAWNGDSLEIMQRL